MSQNLKYREALNITKKGLKQLNDYLDIQAFDKGYLVVYNFNKEKEYKEERINYEGKQIFIVYLLCL